MLCSVINFNCLEADVPPHMTLRQMNIYARKYHSAIALLLQRIVGTPIFSPASILHYIKLWRVHLTQYYYK